VLNVVLPWILAALIILIVGAACGFIEDDPRSDDPPDTGEGAFRVTLLIVLVESIAKSLP
jgi:hypothetical protein